jgi:FkbM family methyltransferase
MPNSCYPNQFCNMIKKIAKIILNKIKPAKVLEKGHANTDPFFKTLVKLGFNPQHIVDVGANRGNWTRTAMHYFPEAHFSLFEPQADLLEGSDLGKNPKVKIHLMGAGPASSTMKLSKHCRDDSFSFALSEEEARFHGREQIDAPVVSLDEFLPTTEMPKVDILKIDAEGWDLKVLEGAQATAESAEVVLLEASVMNKNFSNKIDLVINYMKSRGFVVFDITELNRTPSKGALWLVEIAFVKANGNIDRQINAYE